MKSGMGGAIQALPLQVGGRVFESINSEIRPSKTAGAAQ